MKFSMMVEFGVSAIQKLYLTTDVRHSYGSVNRRNIYLIKISKQKLPQIYSGENSKLLKYLPSLPLLKQM